MVDAADAGDVMAAFKGSSAGTDRAHFVNPGSGSALLERSHCETSAAKAPPSLYATRHALGQYRDSQLEWDGICSKNICPSVIAAAQHCPRSEVIVVDNGSTDGSAELVLERFPQVRLIALEENLGFGGGSNAGFEHARNDMVVLLNSDMRVERDFLQPLLDGFTDENVFAVSCQIFFSDPGKLREETGLTEGWWQQGGLRVRHRIEPAIQQLYPCFYGGGGSCAFDRQQVSGAGWIRCAARPVLPGRHGSRLSRVETWLEGHVSTGEHRVSRASRDHRTHSATGTFNRSSRRTFSCSRGKTSTTGGCLFPHFLYAWAGAMLSWLFGDSPERASFDGIARAALQLPRAMASRIHARSLAVISDDEAFRRPLGGYFRDTFGPLHSDRLKVLFVSPYPICPPVHGGGVFMYQTVRETGAIVRAASRSCCSIIRHEREAHAELERICGSVEYVVRMEGRQKAHRVDRNRMRFANSAIRT